MKNPHTYNALYVMVSNLNVEWNLQRDFFNTIASMSDAQALWGLSQKRSCVYARATQRRCDHHKVARGWRAPLALPLPAEEGAHTLL